MSRKPTLISSKPTLLSACSNTKFPSSFVFQPTIERDINMFVSNLPSNITETRLAQEFSNTQYKHINICYNEFTNKSLGYAYITFSNEEAAKEAFNELNNKIIIDDRRLRLLLPLDIMRSGNNNPAVSRKGSIHSVRSESGFYRDNQFQKENHENQSTYTKYNGVLLNYFKESSEIFAKLDNLKEKAASDPTIDEHYNNVRTQAKSIQPNTAKTLFNLNLLMFKDMVESVSEPIFGSNTHFLDICCAPGGFTNYILNNYPDSSGSGITLPSLSQSSGVPPMFEENERFQCIYCDINKLGSSFNLGENFDLVLLDGQNNWSNNKSDYNDFQREAKLLLISQLILGLNHLKKGGIMIVRLCKPEETFYSTIVYILHSLFLEIQLIKPGSSRVARSLFYMICRNYDPIILEPIITGLIKVREALKNGIDVDDFAQYISSFSAENIIKEFGSSLIQLYDRYWEFMYSTLSESFTRVLKKRG